MITEFNDDSQGLQQQNQINQQKYSRADWYEGQQHINRTSIRQKIGERYQLYDFFCSNEEFKKYGIGLFFYFDFLCKICVVFWILALISLPSIYSNYTGDGLHESQIAGFALSQKFSIANQPELKVIIPASNATKEEIKQIQHQNDLRVFDFYEKQHTRRLHVWAPDFAYSIVFFLFVIINNRKTNKINKEYKQNFITPSSYAVEITGIPKTLNNSKEFQHFLNRVCIQYNICSANEQAVVEVSLAKNYQDTLYLYKKEEELYDNINIEVRKLQIQGLKSSKKLVGIKREKNLKEKFGTLDSTNYSTIKAYVIFNTFQQKKQFISLIDKYNYPSFITRFIFCCFRPEVPENIKFNSYNNLYVNVDVDEPSNIKWENLDMNSGSQLLRKILVFIALILLLSITSAIIIVANLFKPEGTQYCPKNDLTFESVQHINDPELVNCFCYQRSMKELAYDDDLLDFCWSPYIQKLLLICITAASSLTIVIINIILQVVMKKFSQFLRYQTFTDETKASTLLLFFCTFINTAILTLLLQSDIYGFILAIFVTNPVPQLKELQSERKREFSSDFDRDWYSRVGTNIMLTILITTISPHVIKFIFIQPIKAFCKRRKARIAIVQQEMNKILEGPEFDLTTHYVSALNIVFVCLFFSSGQPLLLFLGAISLTTQYWVYKYNILRVHQQPPAYDGTLNQMIQTLLPWALIFHLSVGLYMYGNPLIFPKTKDEIKVQISDKLNKAGVYEVDILQNEDEVFRSRALAILILFILFCIIFVLLSADITIVSCLKNIYNSFLNCCCKKNLNQSKVHPMAYKNNSYEYSYLKQKPQMSKNMLSSYDITQNNKYQGIMYALNNDNNYLSTKSGKYATPTNKNKSQIFTKNI